MVLIGVVLAGCVMVSVACGVSYPNTRREKCTWEEECIDARECKSVAIGLAFGRKPSICGWKKNVPMVCCGKDTSGGKTIEPRKWSRISPEGCGARDEPPPEEPESSPEESFSYGDTDEYDYPQGDDVHPRRGSTRGGRRRFYAPDDRDSTEAPTLEPEGKIFAVGGKVAKLEWPWMVAIYTVSSGKQLCGGVLIDNRHVLTAAHCFSGRSRNPEDYSAMVGEIALYSVYQTLSFEAMKVHEGYNARYYYNDIAIMRLKYWRPDVVPACLPVADDLKAGDKGTLLGWGDLSFGGPSSKLLIEVRDLPVIPHRQCDVQYRGITAQAFPRGITDSFLCAGLDEGGKDACQGDSGGPLLHQDETSQLWSAVGIVSFGFGCAEPGYPGVYTKISAFTPWIEEYIEMQNKLAAENPPQAPRPIFVTVPQGPPKPITIRFNGTHETTFFFPQRKTDH